MDEWMNSTEKCVCLNDTGTVNGRGRGGAVQMAAECVVIVVSALKKHENTGEPNFHETSPQGSTLMMLYTL